MEQLGLNLTIGVTKNAKHAKKKKKKEIVQQKANVICFIDYY